MRWKTGTKIAAAVFVAAGVLGYAAGGQETDSAGQPASDGAPEIAAGFPVEAGGAPEYRQPDLSPELQGQSPPGTAGGEFSTDFSRATVPFGQIISGGPGKDGIPAIDEPQFEGVSSAGGRLDSREAVLVTGFRKGGTQGGGQMDDGGGSREEYGGEVRIYPLRILMWHEIVNDTVGGVPVAVTYCPLCNTGIVFLRRFDGRTLDFGTTGRLRYSNLIMYDRQTESWWQQASGRGIAGRYAGGQLRILPVMKLSWEKASRRYPGARVLTEETGYSRPYGRNPYTGYDRAEEPFLYRGPETPGGEKAMERVYAVRLGGQWRAYPYRRLRDERVVRERVGGKPLVIFWEPGRASSLDAAELAEGRDVGSANGFIARLGGEELEFRLRDGAIVDTRTGSRWDASGRAVEGPLEGRQLEPVPGTGHFWFSWSAFGD